MKFSLFYFDRDDTLAQLDKYKLLIESAKFSERHNFTCTFAPQN